MARKSARVSSNIADPSKHFKKMNKARLESYAFNPEHKYNQLAKMELTRRVERKVEQANKKAEEFNKKYGVEHFQKISDSVVKQHRGTIHKINKLERKIANIEKAELSLQAELQGIGRSLEKRFGRPATFEEVYTAYSRKKKGEPYSVDNLEYDIEEGKYEDVFALSDSSRHTLQNLYEDNSQNPFI